ncbi:MAG TPA: DinB family protein [Dietzia timorensis]|jgi:hypothetical protein|uniref:DinB family protein n=1 Tax=Dietzia timorensis TaxID=499555 RepID=A0A921F5N5_9ACTN|nr:DUF664 domain-containing protein [Dietzia timorensis]HJE91074.1 DinB family protein [Dietzia timorensis]
MRDEATSALLSIANEVLDGYVAALGTLDDETANLSPAPGTVNTAFALVKHVHGMSRFWGGSVISGLAFPRDREAEFQAEGTIDDALNLVDEIRSELPAWADNAARHGVLDPSARGTSRTDVADVGPEWILAHMVRELSQHLGHLEVCRDMVLAQD